MEITKEKKNKLKQLLSDLSNSEEKLEYAKQDKLEQLGESINEIKNTDSTSELKSELKDLKVNISKIRNVDLTPMVDLLKEMNTQLAKPMPDRIGDFAPTLKQLVQGISAVRESVDKKPVPVWNWPQYLSTGVRNKSFESINPATEETLQEILTVLGGVSPAKTIHSDHKSVSTAGTQVQLTAYPAQSITIKALIANTGKIYVGDAGVTSSTGFELGNGDTLSLDINDASDVWINSTVNGEGISYITIN